MSLAVLSHTNGLPIRFRAEFLGVALSYLAFHGEFIIITFDSVNDCFFRDKAFIFFLKAVNLLAQANTERFKPFLKAFCVCG